MKTKTLIMILALIFVSTSCEKTTLNNINVKTYIKLLKSGSYDLKGSNGLPDLPPFEPKEIPELLTYATDKQIITGFPHNPISSFFEPDCRLGIYVLWTIESVRQVSTGVNRPLGRFPSLNPILGNKTSGSYYTVDNDTIHQVAFRAYQDWWNSNDDFEQIKNINPLENTNYGWF